jgi:hypothetical protein
MTASDKLEWFNMTGDLASPLPCYHADHTQLSLVLQKVQRFHVLWDEAIIQLFNVPYAYKSVCVLLKIIFYAFMFFWNYFYYQYFKRYWNQTDIFTLQTNSDNRQFPCSQLTMDIKAQWHFNSISNVYVCLKLQFMYRYACCCSLLKPTITCIRHTFLYLPTCWSEHLYTSLYSFSLPPHTCARAHTHTNIYTCLNSKYVY